MESETLELLSPLHFFCARRGRPPPGAVRVEPEEIPEPYRSLLVHTVDMTSTLGDFHGGGLHLEPLEVIDEPEQYAREVVLRMNGSRKPVEYGAIRIHLSRLPAVICREIRDARRPLGALLEEHGEKMSSRPVNYLRVTPDRAVRAIFGEGSGDPLFARQNRIMNRNGECIADVLEILPR